VYIEVDHGHAQQTPSCTLPFGLHQARRDGDIVEDAVACTLVGARMVRSTGQIGGYAVLESGAGSSDGRTHRPPRTLDHRRTPRETDLALLSRAQRTLDDGAYVVRRVRQCQLTIGRSGSFDKFQIGLRVESLAQQAVLAHREAMTLRQWQGEMVRVVGLHRRRKRSALCRSVGATDEPPFIVPTCAAGMLGVGAGRRAGLDCGGATYTACIAGGWRYTSFYGAVQHCYYTTDLSPRPTTFGD